MMTLLMEGAIVLRKAEESELELELQKELGIDSQRVEEIRERLDRDFLEGLSGGFSLLGHLARRKTGTSGD